MKKDRNTFFQESGFMSQTSYPNPNLNIANSPFTTQSFSNQGFYAGPQITMPTNYNTQIPQNTNYSNDYYSDIEARLSKIERQINRIDVRLQKLENGSFYTTDDVDTNNVYMI